MPVSFRLNPNTDISQTAFAVQPCDGITYTLDGGVVHCYKNKTTMSILDRLYAREEWNLWLPKNKHLGAWNEWTEYFSGKHCFVIGKGITLDTLTNDDFAEADVVLCINESVHTIDRLELQIPVIAVQQDGGLRNACTSAQGFIWTGLGCMHWYADQPYRYVFDRGSLNAKGVITGGIAIRLARRLGCDKFTLRAFDGSVTGSTKYAPSIGYSPSKGGDPIRFTKHRPMLEAALEGTEYIIR